MGTVPKIALISQARAGVRADDKYSKKSIKHQRHLIWPLNKIPIGRGGRAREHGRAVSLSES